MILVTNLTFYFVFPNAMMFFLHKIMPILIVIPYFIIKFAH